MLSIVRIICMENKKGIAFQAKVSFVEVVLTLGYAYTFLAVSIVLSYARRVLLQRFPVQQVNNQTLVASCVWPTSPCRNLSALLNVC